MSKSIHDLKLGQVLTIGDVTVRLEKKSGQLARLAIEAPSTTPVKLSKETNAHECISSHQEKYTHGKHAV